MRTQTAKSRRTRAWAIAASVAVHVAVLTAAFLQRPMLHQPTWQGGPPEPIIPVLLMPRTPSAAGQAAPVRPIRLHRRPQPFAPTPVPPLPVPPETPKAAAAPSAEPKTVPAFHPAPQPEGPKGDLKTTLRQSYVGCANPNAVGLTRAERDLCDEKLGKGAKNVDFAGLGLAPDKQRALDAAAAKKESDYRYKYGAATQAVPEGSQSIGMSAEQRCAALGVSAEECGAHSHR